MSLFATNTATAITFWICLTIVIIVGMILSYLRDRDKK